MPGRFAKRQGRVGNLLCALRIFVLHGSPRFLSDGCGCASASDAGTIRGCWTIRHPIDRVPTAAHHLDGSIGALVLNFRHTELRPTGGVYSRLIVRHRLPVNATGTRTRSSRTAAAIFEVSQKRRFQHSAFSLHLHTECAGSELSTNSDNAKSLKLD